VALRLKTRAGTFYVKFSFDFYPAAIKVLFVTLFCSKYFIMTARDSSGHTLPDTASQPTSGLTTPDLVAAEKNQYDQKDEEKEIEQIETSQVDGEEGANPIETSPVDGEEYPTGSSLVFILISLILSVFLVALDMVSRRSISTFAWY
jgi:hypothetical protein